MTDTKLLVIGIQFSNARPDHDVAGPSRIPRSSPGQSAHARSVADQHGTRFLIGGVEEAELTARYFAQLCLAILRIESDDAVPDDLLTPERLLEMLELSDRRGLGPHSRIVAQPL